MSPCDDMDAAVNMYDGEEAVLLGHQWQATRMFVPVRQLPVNLACARARGGACDRAVPRSDTTRTLCISANSTPRHTVHENFSNAALAIVPSGTQTGANTRQCNAALCKHARAYAHRR